MIVISDTTPIITLMKLDRLELLRDIFAEITIPEAVYAELTNDLRFLKETETIRHADYIHVAAALDRHEVNRVMEAERLDRGESEAILLAKRLNADILLMDEARGRSAAKSMGISITGTIGVLLSAYQRELLTKADIADCIQKLQYYHRRIGPQYLRMLMDLIER